jgi:hypothetical protein
MSCRVSVPVGVFVSNDVKAKQRGAAYARGRAPAVTAGTSLLEIADKFDF